MGSGAMLVFHNDSHVLLRWGIASNVQVMLWLKVGGGGGGRTHSNTHNNFK
mgnify:CR=1 FL=1